MGSVGTVVEERYRLTRLVGAGGMGEVYEAVDEESDSPVAVKLLAQRRASDPRANRRFEREIAVSRSLDHHNVCKVLDFGSHEGTPFFVMPLLDGEPLSLRISRGPLEAEQALQIAMGVLEGLEAAHERGLVHRDLKPDNVFLARDGDGATRPVIVDFGISKAMESAVSGPRDETITRTGSVLGTPNYMAPEQARCAHGVDERVDVYAVGATLYEMLTGVRAIVGKGYNEVLWHIWNTRLVPPRHYCPELPPWIEHVVLTAMSRDPAVRFPSARAMRRTIDQGLSGQTAEIAESLPITETLDPLELPPGSRDASRSTADGSPRRRGLTHLLAGLVGMGAVLVLAPFGGSLFGEERGEAVTDLPAAIAPATEPEEADPTASPVAAEGAMPHTAAAEEAMAPAALADDMAGSGAAPATEVVLEGLPPRARVRVDGAEVPGREVLLPAGGSAVVEVTAPGFRRWRRSVDGQSAPSVAVRMRPLPAQASTRAPSGPDGARPAAAAAPAEPDLLTSFGEVP